MKKVQYILQARPLSIMTEPPFSPQRRKLIAIYETPQKLVGPLSKSKVKIYKGKPGHITGEMEERKKKKRKRIATKPLT